MRPQHLNRQMLSLALAAVMLAALAGCAGKRVAPTAALTPDEVREIAIEAYIYGYSLVTMETTRRVMTNAAAPKGPHAPMGQFASLREYPTAAFKDITAPNADTLYSAAWLDLKKEPYVLSIPDEDGRYFLMPMLSAWTNVFASPGKRTSGTKAQTYAITGPGWKGALPPGVTELKAPTNMVWILGRTYCTGTPEDYAAVHAIQDQYKLVPLSAYGKPYTPPAGTVDPAVDMKKPVREQVNAIPVQAFFSMMARLMVDNPPAAEDAPILARMARIGIVPGKPFDPRNLPAGSAEQLAGVPKAVKERLTAVMEKSSTSKNGWLVLTNLGTYGTDYPLRALTTAVGLGANLPADAVYPMYNGPKLDGTKKHVVHIAKGMLPPVDGFWSLTMYNDRYFFVDNPLNRYTLSSRSKLKKNKDGSIDLYLQRESPGKAREANWLPTPDGVMIPMFRLYWPKATPPSILDGTWTPPAITPAE